MRNVLVDGGGADAQCFCRFGIGHFFVVVESEDAFVLLREVLVDDACQLVHKFLPLLLLVSVLHGFQLGFDGVVLATGAQDVEAVVSHCCHEVARDAALVKGWLSVPHLREDVAHGITGIFRFLQKGEGKPIHLSVVALVDVFKLFFVVTHNCSRAAFVPFSACKTHEWTNQIPPCVDFFAKI